MTSSERGTPRLKPQTRVVAQYRWPEMELGWKAPPEQCPPVMALGTVVGYYDNDGERFPYRVRLDDGRTFCYADNELAAYTPVGRRRKR